MDRAREMEEKPEAVMNAVVSNNLLVDPTVSKQFEWVCKSSSHLFENPPVMSMYHNNSTHTSLFLKVHLSQTLLYLLSGERFETRVRLDFPPPFPMSTLAFQVIGSSVNGILCLDFGYNRVVLWNPSTKEIKIVPPSPVEFESPYREPKLDYQGFGYDHVRDDYKVIRYVQFCTPLNWPYKMKNVSLEPFWEIYSLRSDSWKKLDYKMPCRSFLDWNGRGLYIGGVCHWLGLDENCHVWSLVSFDLSKEVFFTTPMPSYIDGSFRFTSMQMRLAEINGYVALISNYQEKTTIEVSILGEFGVKESWTKLFIIGPLPCVVNLIEVGKKGDIFFKNKDDGLAWFDWSTRMIVDLGLKLPHGEIVTYKENFESLTSVGFEKYEYILKSMLRGGSDDEKRRREAAMGSSEESLSKPDLGVVMLCEGDGGVSHDLLEKYLGFGNLKEFLVSERMLCFETIMDCATKFDHQR